MSICAMNWAMKQRTDAPSAQIVLYVIADSASETGVSAHADPDYIAERTRQSRATVFRRLDELEKAGLITRLVKHKSDGARSYEVRLHLRTFVNYKFDKAGEIEFLGDDDKPINKPLGVESQIETHHESQSAPGNESGISAVRLSESQSCDPLMNPSKSPDSPPYPPPGGDAQHSDDFEKGKADSWARFETAWQEPILRQSIARQVWRALTETEEDIAIKAAKGYVVHRRSQKKPPNVINAHTFLRERDAWAGFAALAPLPPAPPAPPPRFIAADSEEFKARCVLDVLRGLNMRQPKNTPNGFGCVVPNVRMGPDALVLSTFADTDRATWFAMEVETHRHQVGAWNERVKDWTGDELKGERIETGEFTEILGKRYPKYKTIFRVPIEWPPRKDGSLSATGPPQAA
jgi:hypothetical protein